MLKVRRVTAAIQALVYLEQLYDGTPVSLATLSQASSLSLSYLEQIFSRLLARQLVFSHRGPGGGYSLAVKNITVADVFRAVNDAPQTDMLAPIIQALETVSISQLAPCAPPVTS